jgi:hypothetical protein
MDPDGRSDSQMRVDGRDWCHSFSDAIRMLAPVCE